MRRPSPNRIADTGTIALLTLLLAAAALRLLLSVNLPLWLRHTVVQDGLYLRLAESLASGQWLGPYDQLTLMRGLGYPAFLAASSLSGLPISAAHGLFQIIAVAVASWALYRLTDSRALAATAFLVLLFDPVGLMPNMNRVIAEQVSWPQVLLTFSLAAVLLYVPQRRWSTIALSAIVGILLAWARLTQESGSLLLLGILALIAGAGLVRRRDRAALHGVLFKAAVIGAAFLVATTTVMTANFFAYGSFSAFQPKLMQDTAAKPFLGALESVVRRVALLDVDDPRAVPTTLNHSEPKSFAKHMAFLGNPFTSIAGTKGLPTTVDGWYYDSSSMSWPSFAVLDRAGKPLPFALKRISSPDLQRHFKTDRPAWNRFSLTYRCPDSCTVAVRAFNRPELRRSINRERDLSKSTGSATLYVDIVRSDWSASADLDPLKLTAIQARNGLSAFYQLLLPLLIFAGVIALIAATDGAIAARTLNPVLLIAGTAWLLVARQLVCLALADSQKAPAATVPNTAAAAYLAALATFLSFAAVVVQARQSRPQSL